jgi:hypothetical protein
MDLATEDILQQPANTPLDVESTIYSGRCRIHLKHPGGLFGGSTFRSLDIYLDFRRLNDNLVSNDSFPDFADIPLEVHPISEDTYRLGVVMYRCKSVGWPDHSVESVALGAVNFGVDSSSTRLALETGHLTVAPGIRQVDWPMSYSTDLMSSGEDDSVPELTTEDIINANLTMISTAIFRAAHQVPSDIIKYTQMFKLAQKADQDVLSEVIVEPEEGKPAITYGEASNRASGTSYSVLSVMRPASSDQMGSVTIDYSGETPYYVAELLIDGVPQPDVDAAGILAAVSKGASVFDSSDGGKPFSLWITENTGASLDDIYSARISTAESDFDESTAWASVINDNQLSTGAYAGQMILQFLFSREKLHEVGTSCIVQGRHSAKSLGLNDIQVVSEPLTEVTLPWPVAHEAYVSGRDSFDFDQLHDSEDSYLLPEQNDPHSRASTPNPTSPNTGGDIFTLEEYLNNRKAFFYNENASLVAGGRAVFGAYIGWLGSNPDGSTAIRLSEDPAEVNVYRWEVRGDLPPTRLDGRELIWLAQKGLVPSMLQQIPGTPMSDDYCSDMIAWLSSQTADDYARCDLKLPLRLNDSYHESGFGEHVTVTPVDDLSINAKGMSHYPAMIVSHDVGSAELTLVIAGTLSIDEDYPYTRHPIWHANVWGDTLVKTESTDIAGSAGVIDVINQNTKMASLIEGFKSWCNANSTALKVSFAINGHSGRRIVNKVMDQSDSAGVTSMVTAVTIPYSSFLTNYDFPLNFGTKKYRNSAIFVRDALRP